MRLPKLFKNKMDSPTIEITSQGATTVQLEELHELHDFKTFTDEDYVKCRNSLTDPDIGFSFPLSIWIDNEGKKWTVDGHQRIKTLRRMKDEGFSIPPLPADLVFAPNKQKAAKKITASESHYGDIINTEFSDFLEEYEITYEEIEPFTDIEVLDDPEEEATGGSSSEPKEEKKITCPNCQTIITLDK